MLYITLTLIPLFAAIWVTDLPLTAVAAGVAWGLFDVALSLAERRRLDQYNVAHTVVMLMVTSVYVVELLDRFGYVPT